MPQFLFYMSGNVLWGFFSSCLGRSSGTFTGNARIFGKVYFPRLVMPIAGAVTAVIASDPAVHGGAIGAEEAKKAAKLISFADAFGIPVVTLVDSIGVSDDESPALAGELARLASAYASAVCPMVTVVCGKAYGLGFTLLGAKSLGADIVFALPEASIGLLSPESAVAFVWNSRIDETISREMLEEEWREAYASPAEAACRGEIDDVIEARELRLRVGAAVSMLLYKNGEAPFRRHAVAPL
jgi:acetyl-CoA carboxylase carboxyltransferase component